MKRSRSLSSMDGAEAIAEFAGGRGSMKLLTTPSHTRNGPVRAFSAIKYERHAPRASFLWRCHTGCSQLQVCLPRDFPENKLGVCPFPKYWAQILAHSACSITLWSMEINDLGHFYFLLNRTIEHTRQAVKKDVRVGVPTCSLPFLWGRKFECK